MLRVVFDYDGGSVGKGGEAHLLVGGQEVGHGHIAKTTPAWLSEPGTIGRDSGTPLTKAYEVPFNFERHIEKVDFDLVPAAALTPADKGALKKAAVGKE